MPLPNLFEAPPDEAKLYLAIYIDDVQIQSALWKVEQGKIQILRTSATFTYQGEAEALTQTDESLQELGKESEGVEEVVFGFEPDWVSEGDITPGKKPFIKKLTQELSLKPVGFVISTEAMAQYLAMSEPLLSVIVVQLSDQFLTMNLIQRGQTLSYQKVGRSGDSVADLREALARSEQALGSDYLPPKMILVGSEFDQEYLQDQKSSLLDFDWKSEHPFLQPPVIEIGPARLVVTAVAIQGGTAVAQAAGMTLQPTSPALTKPVVAPAETPTTITETAAADLGFAAVKEEITPSSPHDLAVDLENGTTFSDNLGQVTTPTSFGVPIKPSSTKKEAVAEENAESPAEMIPSKVATPKTTLVTQLKKWWQKAMADDKPRNRKPFIIAGVGGGVVLLLGIFFLFSNVAAQAEITVKLNTKTVNQTAKITIDPEATAPDAANLILPAQVQQKEVSGNKTIDTTGVKLIGDKAQGKVEMSNKTDSEKTFAQGTQLKTGELVFVLNEEVTVPAATTEENSDGETKKYGKTEVAVTADQIGAESNLTEGEEFQVASFATNTYQAVATEDFSGGSSREVRVVSAEDLSTLKADLRSELLAQASQEYSDESKNGTYYVPTGSSNIQTAEYSAEEGEEVNTVTLQMTLKVEAVAYSSADLKPLARELLSSQVPENYSLSEADPQILSSTDESASAAATVTLNADISTKAVPNLNLDQLKTELLGKSIEEAESSLKSNDQLKAFAIEIQPPLLAKFVHTIPKNGDKVTIRVQDE